MNFHVLTLFPDMVSGGLNTSILGRAAAGGHISLETVNIRDFTENKHKKVDDYPYGGGAGMLMQAQPVYDAYRSIEEKILENGGKKPRVIYVTPQGRVFNQQMAQELALEEELVFLCGHYEGIDERVLETIVTDYVSIGDYVLTGGELPSMVMIDAVSRLVPGVLKNEESAEFESFHNNLLEYPQYTRPEVWQGKTVPDILLSGDHAKVDKWRLLQSEERTRERRPDLYEAYAREGKALSWLLKKKIAHMDMIEVIRRGQAELLCGEEEGVLLRDVPSGAYMISAADEDMGERLLSLIPRGLKDGLYVAHQEFLKESICRRFKGSVINTCVQAVYTRKTPLEEDSRFCIKTLDTSYLEEVYFHYHAVHDKVYLEERLRSGMMYGAFADGKLAGFIGMHAEGSMGILEVFEEFRRQGIAEALERHLINRILEKGWVPFCQIFTDNEASVKLQQKLGLRIGRDTVYWIS